MFEVKDVDAIREHSQRLFARMKHTPHGPKRLLLAEQHIAKADEAKFAEGWNAAIEAYESELTTLRAQNAALVDALTNLVNSFEKHRPKEYWDAARNALAQVAK